MRLPVMAKQSDQHWKMGFPVRLTSSQHAVPTALVVAQMQRCTPGHVATIVEAAFASRVTLDFWQSF